MTGGKESNIVFPFACSREPAVDRHARVQSLGLSQPTIPVLSNSGSDQRFRILTRSADFLYC